MKKNWIVWKRTLGASICELVCPIVLMAILAISRLLVTSSEIAAKSNIGSTSFMIPSTDLLTTPNTTLFAQQSEFASFANFGQFNYSQMQPVMKFIPYHCKKSRFVDASPIVAFAGNSSYTAPIIRDLQAMCKS
jgi:hypothetical protein